MAIDTTKLNFTNGIIAGVILIAGVVFCLVMGIMFRYDPFWTVGVSYILPGLFGILASGMKRNATYLLQMGVCILCLIVDVAVAVLFFHLFSFLNFGLVFLSIAWILKLTITILSGILLRTDSKNEPDVMMQASNIPSIQMRPLDARYLSQQCQADYGVQGVSYQV